LFIFATEKKILMDKPKYKRILLKLSGEALSSDGEVLEPSILEQYAQEIKKIHDLGVEVAIVIGGGNIFRGASLCQSWYRPCTR
jgi:uridylate kinase